MNNEEGKKIAEKVNERILEVEKIIEEFESTGKVKDNITIQFDITLSNNEYILYKIVDAFSVDRREESLRNAFLSGLQEQVKFIMTVLAKSLMSNVDVGKKLQIMKLVTDIIKIDKDVGNSAKDKQ